MQLGHWSPPKMLVLRCKQDLRPFAISGPTVSQTSPSATRLHARTCPACIIAAAIDSVRAAGTASRLWSVVDPLPGLEGGVAVGADGFRDAVRHAIKRGADVIKVCISSGIGDAWACRMRFNLRKRSIDAVVDEALSARGKGCCSQSL